MTLEHGGEQSLQALTAIEATNWMEIGHTLFALEAHSRVAPSGRAWQDVLLARLKELDSEISSGHLYKIRRAYAFLLEHAPEGSVSKAPTPPKISAVEISERLYRLDPEAGKQALEDALAVNPTPYVELKHRYERALQAAPEMKSPRQLAWEVRRKGKASSFGTSIDNGPTTAAVGPAETLADQPAYGPSAGLQQRLDEFLSDLWQEGWRAAEQQYAAEIAALRATIHAQAEDIADQAEELKQQEAEIEVLVRKVKELRGYYPEDFED